MRMSIKRCPLTQLPDVSWEVADWQQSVVHPTYDITGEHLGTWCPAFGSLQPIVTNVIVL
jgi:hypothetical protein